MSAYIELTDENFAKEVEESKGVVLVDFWAAWCGPCQILGPIIEEIANEQKDTAGVQVGKLEVDESPQTAMKYNITSIPTVAVFKDGKIVDQIMGIAPKGDLVKLIEKAK